MNSAEILKRLETASSEHKGDLEALAIELADIANLFRRLNGLATINPTYKKAIDFYNELVAQDINIEFYLSELGARTIIHY